MCHNIRCGHMGVDTGWGCVSLAAIVQKLADWVNTEARLGTYPLAV